MSTTVLEVLQDCALDLGDPNMGRITQPQLLLVYNRAQRKICSRLNALEDESTFPWIADHRYLWPENAVRVKWIAGTETPADPNSYKFLVERPLQTWKDETHGNYPVGALPEKYYAGTGWFTVWPKPTTMIDAGGLVAFWRVPGNVLSVDGAFMELPDFARDHVVGLMRVYAKRLLKRYDEAREDYRDYLADEPELKERLEDRSEDMRPRLRVASQDRLTGGMI